MAQSKKQKLEAAWKLVEDYFKAKRGDIAFDKNAGLKADPLLYIGSFFGDSSVFCGCCGAEEIYELADNCDSRTVSAVDKAAQYLMFHHKPFADKFQGIVIASTVPSQTYAIALLKHIGFKPSCRAYNKNSGNIVTLWSFATRTDKNKPRRS